MESLDIHSYRQYVYNGPIYNHLGALLTDIVLQSGLNYQTVVRPRVRRVLTEFGYASTTPLIRSAVHVYSAGYFLNWSNSIKTNRLIKILEFLQQHQIEDENQCRQFLLVNRNRERFLQINGIGPKTVDYALKLMGEECVAVDRHVYSFVKQAGIATTEYYDVKMIVEFAADLLCLSRAHVDGFIWSLMNKRSLTKQTSLSF